MTDSYEQTLQFGPLNLIVAVLYQFQARIDGGTPYSRSQSRRARQFVMCRQSVLFAETITYKSGLNSLYMEPSWNWQGKLFPYALPKGIQKAQTFTPHSHDAQGSIKRAVYHCPRIPTLYIFLSPVRGTQRYISPSFPLLLLLLFSSFFLLTGCAGFPQVFHIGDENIVVSCSVRCWSSVNSPEMYSENSDLEVRYSSIVLFTSVLPCPGILLFSSPSAFSSFVQKYHASCLVHSQPSHAIDIPYIFHFWLHIQS